jgi:tRNA(Ile2) C34 agmatinyltransferase TiaS
MKYICKECGHIEYWTAQLFAEKGEPVCPECDGDMKLAGCAHDWDNFGKCTECGVWKHTADCIYDHDHGDGVACVNHN